MKTISYLLLITVFLRCNGLYSQVSLITGRMESKVLLISYKDEFGHIKDYFFKKKHTENDSIIKIDIDNLSQIRFPDGFRQRLLYTKPNETITIQNFVQNGKQQLYFKGIYENEYNFPTVLDSCKLGLDRLDLQSIEWNSKTDYVAVLAQHDSLYRLRLSILNHYSDSLRFDKTYYNLYKNEIELIYLLGYMHPFFGVSNKSTLSDEYFNHLDQYVSFF